MLTHSIFLLELATTDVGEEVNLAYEIRERLFYRSTFGDKLIQEYTGQVRERYLGKAA